MTEEVRKKIEAEFPYEHGDGDGIYRYSVFAIRNAAEFGYSLATEQLAEKDRIIAELNLSLNEAEKKIKQLDTKPY